MSGLDQYEAGRIDPERAQAMTIQPAGPAQAVARQDEEQRPCRLPLTYCVFPRVREGGNLSLPRCTTLPLIADCVRDRRPPPQGGRYHLIIVRTGRLRLRHVRQQRGEKAERGGDGSFAGRDDLMQRAAGKSAVREAGIERGQAKGEGCA